MRSCQGLYVFCCIVLFSFFAIGQCRYKGFYRYPLQALWSSKLPLPHNLPSISKWNNAPELTTKSSEGEKTYGRGPLEQKFWRLTALAKAKAKTAEGELKNETPALLLKNYNSKGQKILNRAMKASWNTEYTTSVNDADLVALMEAEKFSRAFARSARKFLKSGKKMTQEMTRALRLISYDISSSNKANRQRLDLLEEKMSAIYNRTGIAIGEGMHLIGEERVIDFFKSSRDPDQLKKAWILWHDKTGEQVKKIYPEIVRLNNQNAKEAGFVNYDEFIDMSEFDAKDLTKLLLQINQQLEPLYKELFGFARSRLFMQYPTGINPFGKLPMHVFGDPWAKDWRNIFDILRPAPLRCLPLAEERMKTGNWTVEKMVKAGEQFFTSMGLSKMTKSFWKKSIFTKPKDRKVDCEPVVRDFLDGKDYRLAMCAKVGLRDLNIIHYELGHIEYAMAYAKQQLEFRADEDNAFHNAIAATFELASGTLQHLQKLQLLSGSDNCQDEDINYLLKKALVKIPFIPFGLSVYLWRQGVYNGSIPHGAFNKEFWNLRERYQGLVPPKMRNVGFDSGAKLHITSGENLIVYLVAHIVEFQLYEAACKASGHTGPLHRCDFSGSKDAGNLLRKAMELGRSKKWIETVKLITGESKIHAGSLLRYFDPLMKWLGETRMKEGYDNSWW